MTREALTAELAALDARRVEIEQQLADMGAGLLRESATPTVQPWWEKYPVIEKLRAYAADEEPRTRTVQQLESALSGVGGTEWEVSHLMDVPK
jgi:hypothetical protein